MGWGENPVPDGRPAVSTPRNRPSEVATEGLSEGTRDSPLMAGGDSDVQRDDRGVDSGRDLDFCWIRKCKAISQIFLGPVSLSLH